MGRVKNQHYVAQMSLRPFTMDGTRLWVFDKATKKSFVRNIDELASENGFYDLAPEFAADFQVVEKTFQKVEADSAPHFGDLLTEVERNGEFDARKVDRLAVLSNFLALQNLRTRAFRDTFSKLHDSFEDIVKQKFEFMREHHESQTEKVDIPEIDVKIPKERLAFEHVMMMFRPDYLLRAARALGGKMWLVGRNDSPDPFFTSDDPFVLHGP